MASLRATLAILFVCSWGLLAATYYISPTGDDTTGDGSSGTPWKSWPKALTNRVAGDTIFAKPGIYTAAGNSNSAAYVAWCCWCTNKATLANPIVMQATPGTVTNQFGFYMKGTGFKFDGLIFDTAGLCASGVFATKSSGFITMTNCIVQYSYAGNEASTCGFGVESPSTGDDPMKTAGTNLITDCTFWHNSNSCTIALHGVGNLVERCRFSDNIDGDTFRLFGSNSIVRSCVLSNLTSPGIYSAHADLIQTFGDNGFWMADMIFERNYVVDCPNQLTQMTMDTVTNPALWGITFRNNVFERLSTVTGFDIANVHYLNNTFYRCAGNMALGFFDPGGLGMEGYRGQATGFQAVNNAFIESGAYPYSIVNAFPQQGALTTNEFAGGGRSGSGYARVGIHGPTNDVSYNSGLRVYGTYTGLSSAISNAVFYNVGGNDMYYVDATNFVGGAFDYKQAINAMAGGYTEAQQWTIFNGVNFAFRINTVNFPAGEISGTMVLPPITPTPTILADYNFYAHADGSAFVAISNETHSINGGTLLIIHTNTPKPMLASSLIDVGTNLATTVTNDFDGNARPLGSAHDIGAYEFDPSLVVHLDFDQGFESTNYVMDVTGHTNHGYQMDSTNWVYSTNGVFGTKAAWFRYVGQMTNDLPSIYPLSQYIALTNTMTGYAYLTNATISFWAQLASNTDTQMRVLDCGYPVGGADDPAKASNSWAICRNGGTFLELALNPAAGGYSDIALFSNDVNAVVYSNSAFHLYTLTIECATNNTVIAYYDGVQFYTNTIGVPWLHTYGDYVVPWLCVGAMSHDGTPQWGDDKYPNSCFFVGRLDDLRIYNRTLSAPEVAALYVGNGAALSGGGGGGTNASGSTARALTANVNLLK